MVLKRGFCLYRPVNQDVVLTIGPKLRIQYLLPDGDQKLQTLLVDDEQMDDTIDDGAHQEVGSTHQHPDRQQA